MNPTVIIHIVAKILQFFFTNGKSLPKPCLDLDLTVLSEIHRTADRDMKHISKLLGQNSFEQVIVEYEYGKTRARVLEVAPVIREQGSTGQTLLPIKYLSRFKAEKSVT